jgi:hypothetical protein
LIPIHGATKGVDPPIHGDSATPSSLWLPLSLAKHLHPRSRANRSLTLAIIPHEDDELCGSANSREKKARGNEDNQGPRLAHLGVPGRSSLGNAWYQDMAEGSRSS